MDADSLRPVRVHLAQTLADAGHTGPWTDRDSLFLSGRLDSLALTQLVLFLEQRFALDFGALDFSAEQVDSVEAIAALLRLQVGQGA